MNIFVYSDESGVFDKQHNNYYVYGGLLFLSKDDKDIFSRKYRAAERAIAHKYEAGIELKATSISNNDKGKLFRSLNNCIKFGTIINQLKVFDNIYENKKSKQRYLDYAYKIGLKNVLLELAHQEKLDVNDISNMYIYVDEHTTATNGLYELKECLLQEFKYGTYNWNYTKFFKPLFPNMNSLDVTFCNSAKIPLIRAADIVANKLYFSATHNRSMPSLNSLYLKYLP